MVPSNFRLVVESRGREHFVAAMKMCFDDFPTATHYKIDSAGMHLFWGKSMSVANAVEEPIPLPYEMNVDAAIEFVWGWLQAADRGPEPDLDGSCKRDGFIVENTKHGWSYRFVRVLPVWSEYHK